MQLVIMRALGTPLLMLPTKELHARTSSTDVEGGREERERSGGEGREERGWRKEEGESERGVEVGEELRWGETEGLGEDRVVG